MKMTRYPVFILSILLAPALLAQDTTAPEGAPAGEIEDQQVIIEKDKPLTLPPANRIYQRTNVTPIQVDTVQMDYNITQPTYEFTPYFAEFKFRSYEAGAGDDQGYPNYVKAGFGNYISPLLQGYFGVDYDANQLESHAGLWFNHESFARGPVREEESAYSLSEFLIDGTVGAENWLLKPEIYYQREGYYFYGYDADMLESLAPEEHPFITDRIASNHFSISADIQMWEVDRYDISIRPFYQITSMKQKGEEAFNEENVVGAAGSFAYSLNEEMNIGISTRYSHFNYQSGVEQVRDAFKLHPYISYQNDILRLEGGIKYFLASDSLVSGAQSNFYPDLAANVKLSPDLAVFAELNGDLKPTSLNDLRLSNRYLEDSLALLNQSVKLNFRGGVEVNLLEKMLLRGYVQYKQSDNRPLFFHSPSDSSRFLVLYDPENFNEFGLGVEGKYHIGTQTSVSASLQLLGYETDTVSEAWYLPSLRANLYASHTLNEVFTLRTNIEYLDGIKAPDPVTSEAQKLNAIVDWSFGAQYDFIPQAGVFIDVDNILATNFERYLNYPSRGFMIKLGFIYRF